MSNDLKTIMTDKRFNYETRLIRLTGWRDDEVEQASAAGNLVRLAPAVCAVGSFAGVLFQSPLILAVFAISAAIGLLAPNHPVEVIANAIAVRRGRTPQPPNRAGRRLGCAMGAVILGGAAVAYAGGATSLGAGLALSMGFVATFVAVTNICVPSMILTLVGGSNACTRPQLVTFGTGR